MVWQEWSQQGLNAMGKLVADIIVETLQNAGVKHCYGVVGDTLNQIARSIAASKIEWVHMRHEEAGAFAAAARAATRQAALLGQIARRADFLEAVSWQNPDLVEPMIVALGQMGADAPNNQRLRKRQRIVAKYWARYCAKNETIGFFGPVSWFDFRSEDEPLRMEPIGLQILCSVLQRRCSGARVNRRA